MKETTIQMRVTRDQKDEIQREAANLGEDVTSYIMSGHESRKAAVLRTLRAELRDLRAQLRRLGKEKS